MTVIAKATTQYPRGNDEPTVRSADARVTGDVSTQDIDDTEEVVFDSTLLDEKVRQMIESAGFKYDVRRAVENGTMRKITVDDELAAARLRLQEAAPLLNAAVALAQRRAAQARRSPLEDLLGKATPTSYDNSPSAVADYKNGSASGSESGSTSGSESGSASGSRSGGMSKALIERFLAGDREAGLALMGLR